MINDEELIAADLIGRRLLKVTTAWHHYADDDPSLLHLWLHLEGLGPVLFHTPSTGVSLRADQPHGPYSMEEYGSVSVIDDSPDVPVTRFVGQTIRSVRQIDYNDGRVDFAAGLTLQFPSGSIRLLGLVDDLLIAHDQHLGTVEAHLHEDVDTWDGEESRLWTNWDDGTNGGWIELAAFLAMAGLRLAPEAEVHTAPPIDPKV